MRWVRGYDAGVLCCAAGAAGAEEKPDARLQEARTAFDEANRLWDAGRYADAIARGEQSLALREAVLGGTHPDVARCLDLLGFHHLLSGKPCPGRAAPSARAGHSGSGPRQESPGGRSNAHGPRQPLPGPGVLRSCRAALCACAGDPGSGPRREPSPRRRVAQPPRQHLHGPGVVRSGRAALFARAGHSGSGPRQEPSGGRSNAQRPRLPLPPAGVVRPGEPLFLRALAIREAALGKNHPLVADSLETLATSTRTGVVRACRAAPRACAGHSGSGPRQEPSRCRRLALQTRHPLLEPGVGSLVPSRSTSARWPFGKRPLARAIPSSPISLNKLACLYRPRGCTARPSRSTSARWPFGKRPSARTITSSPTRSSTSAPSTWPRGCTAGPSHSSSARWPFGKRPSARTISSSPTRSSTSATSTRPRDCTPVPSRFFCARWPLEAVLGKNHPSSPAAQQPRQPLPGPGVVRPSRAVPRARAGHSGSGLWQEPSRRRRRRSTTSPTSTRPRGCTAGPGRSTSARSPFGKRLSARTIPVSLKRSTTSPWSVWPSIASPRPCRCSRAPSPSPSSACARRRSASPRSRLARFLQFLRADEERLYALLRAHPDNARVRRLALGAALLLKGRSVEESADISRTVYRSLGAQDRDTFERLRGLRTQLAQLSLQGPGSLPPAAYQQRLEELSEQGAALEADLARRSAPLRALAALPSPAEIVDRVAAALPRDGALVEFITYVDRPLVPRPGTPESQRPGELRYLALVLFPDATIRFRDLGPAEPIDSAASRLRDALANRDAAFQASAQALYQLAFQPLLPLLGKTRRLFLSPDGQLALVPFAALHDGQQFLVDAFDFTYLPSGKDLLPRPEESTPLAPWSSWPTRTSAPRSQHPLTPRRSSSAGHALHLRRALLLHAARGPGATRLGPRPTAGHPPGGRGHPASAAPGPALPGPRGHQGAAAAAASPRHPPPGHPWLLPGGRARAPGLPRRRPLRRAGRGPAGPAALRTPCCARASSWRGRAPEPSGSSPAQPPAENALVTALELAGLNLWGTQLVVLSACDTGRGDVKLGQGVYGLRRAFVVAGAETVVMSLWKVNDETTRAADGGLLPPPARGAGPRHGAARGDALVAADPAPPPLLGPLPRPGQRRPAPANLAHARLVLGTGLHGVGTGAVNAAVNVHDSRRGST